VHSPACQPTLIGTLLRTLGAKTDGVPAWVRELTPSEAEAQADARLVVTYLAGGKVAQDRLGHRVLHLLEAPARRIRARCTLSQQDLVQAGAIGILRLVQAGKFDATRGSFRKWVVFNSRKWMMREVRRQGNDVHLSDHAHQAVRAKTGTSRGASREVLEAAASAPLSGMSIDVMRFDDCGHGEFQRHEVNGLEKILLAARNGYWTGGEMVLEREASPPGTVRRWAEMSEPEKARLRRDITAPR
jgi:hypothetical protein